MSEAQELLGEFGKGIGMDDLAFDAENSCTMSFDDVALTFEFVEEKKSIYFYSTVAELPDDAQTLAVYAYLLEQNSFFKGTGGGTFGIEPDMKLITYTSLFPVRDCREDTVKAFDALAGAHVNAVEGMRAALLALLQGETEAVKEESSAVSDEDLLMHNALRV